MADPGHFDALHLLGVIAYQDGNPQQALALIDQALHIHGANAECWSHRGLALHDLDRWEEALASFAQALQLKPDFAKAHYNRGNTLQALQHIEAAMASYEQAIELKPDYADAQVQLAQCRLLLGDFARGWKGYEWRWSSANFTRYARSFPQPLWLGEESLSGKEILLHGEQGLGDTLQFCRYASLAAAAGARVILEAPSSLEGLLSRLDGVSAFVAKGADLPDFDCHCPLMSLPLAFRTTPATVPSPRGYLRADPPRVEQWRARLGGDARPRVGLVWSGSATHSNDRNRSIECGSLIRELPPQFQYVSLQKDLREGDASVLQSRPDLRHFGAQLQSFEDTAALCELMDAVISVDTSVAHLAGALGRPVFILLPFNPEWRWMLDGSDSPWYASARLFRQQARGDWSGCLTQVTQALQALAR